MWLDHHHRGQPGLVSFTWPPENLPLGLLSHLAMVKAVYGKKGMLAKGYKETFMTIGGGWHFVPYMRTLLPNARVLVARTQRVKQQPTLAVSSTPKIQALVSFHSFASNSTQTCGRPSCFCWFGLVLTKTMKLRV